jgi:taurine dioxygenase
MEWNRPAPIPIKDLNAVRRNYGHITVTPYGGSCGAVVDGIDLSDALDDQTISEVKQAYLDHLVLFFRDQRMEPDGLKTFARHFGDLMTHSFVDGVEGHPEIMVIAKEPDDLHNFGSSWHSDMTFEEHPPLGSILGAIEVPEFGGNTLFANQYLAYDMLSDTYKGMLDGVNAVHSGELVYGPQGEYAGDRWQDGHDGTGIIIDEKANQRFAHPIVRTVPETGGKALFVNEAFTVGIEGMSNEEAEPILHYLYRHAGRPDFGCSFKWEPGSVAFYDNRTVQHYPLNDYHGQRRVLWRLTISGEGTRLAS